MPSATDETERISGVPSAVSVSVSHATAVDELYVCSPGIGVFLVPAMDVETDSDVSPSTRAPETFGVTVNEYVAPAVSSARARLRAAWPTVRVSGATGARTLVTMKSSSRILLSSCE